MILPFVLIFPGVWLTVAWSVSYPALLAEDVRGSKALGRSFGLTKGRWWPTFGALTVTYLIVLVISGILTLLLGSTLIGSLDDEAVAAVLTTIVNTLSSVITLPLLAAVLTIIYYDLRVRKEGVDLHLLARGVGGSSPTSPESVAASSGLGGFAPPVPPDAARATEPRAPPQSRSTRPRSASRRRRPPPRCCAPPTRRRCGG